MSRFYADLPVLTDFSAVTQVERFAALPSDWHVATCDVRDSTAAVHAGDYKQVNTVAAAAVTVGPLPAQDTAFSQQEKARLEFERLTESMQRLQVALAETAPDESKALSGGNRFVQEKRLRERMEAVRDELKGARWDEAIDRLRELVEK